MSQVPIEVCELVDADGRSVGRVVPRGSDRRVDEYFPVIHLWVMDDEGRFLIQRRADHLVTHPGMWATTAGYVQAGETILEATIRETREEMGLSIDPGLVQPIGHWLSEHRRQAVHLLRASRHQLGRIEIGEEVADFRWASIDGIATMVDGGEFVTYGYFDKLIRPLA